MYIANNLLMCCSPSFIHCLLMLDLSRIIVSTFFVFHWFAGSRKEFYYLSDRVAETDPAISHIQQIVDTVLKISLTFISATVVGCPFILTNQQFKVTYSRLQKDMVGSIKILNLSKLLAKI